MKLHRGGGGRGPFVRHTERPRALVYAVKNTYLNPTEEVVFRALGEVFDLEFYGPGYRSLERLDEDARVVFEREGPFDVAVMQQYLWHYYFAGPEGMLELPRSQHAGFDVPEFVRRFPRFGRGLVELPCPKVFMGLRTDTYSFPAEHFEEFEAFPGVLISWSPKTVCPMSEMEGLDLEGFADNVSDGYLEFCNRYPERVIPFEHVVDDEEIFFRPLTTRRRAVCVPGQPYAWRKEAYERLAAEGFCPANVDPLQQRVESLWNRVGPPLYRNRLGIRLMQRGHRRLLSSSLVGYTEGSRLRRPLRKFFEIPAAGALLAAQPFYRSRELGFEADVHYVACTPWELPDVVRKAQSELDWTNSIIHAAQDMLRRYHSRTACARNLRKIWPRIANGTYRGAEWHEGEIVLQPQATDDGEMVASGSIARNAN